MILLVSLAIGNEYLEAYKKTFLKSHEAYAKKCGYDFHVVTFFQEAPFLEQDYERSFLTISMQKILVCSQEWTDQYDTILFIDADVLIHPDAPPLHSAMDYGDKIGIVDEFSQPTREARVALQTRMGWETTGKEYYALCGLDLDCPYVLNTGVLVLQPKKHRPLLESIFKKYIEACKSHPRGFIFEQTVIGYELIQANSYILLPNSFNRLWALQAWTDGSTDLEEFFNQNYFLHFAGKIGLDRVPSLVDRFWPAT
jgi:hypothetical protein